MKTLTHAHYRINNFVFHELPSKDIVVQTKQGIVRITNKAMIDYIKRIDDQLVYKNIAIEDIREHFGPITEDALEFLLNYRIIEENKTFNYKIEELSFFSNDPAFLNMISFVTNEDLKDQGIKVNYQDSIDTVQFKENQLISCFLNPYDRTLAKEIVQKARESNCILLMSYTYNNNLYIDNLYREEWKNPCHFCNMGNLETQLRVEIDGNVTYQQIIDSLYHEDHLFKVEIPLKNKDLLNLVSQIMKTLDAFVLRESGYVQSIEESAQHINESILIDLRVNSVTRDFSIHWELCDCNE